MTDGPSYATPNQAISRTRLSGASVTAMVLGILLCIPLVTSLAAILFAIVGMRTTRNPAFRGRGMAIAGLVLGLVGLLIWSGIGTLVAMVISGSSAPRATLHDFARKLADGNLPAATALCDAIVTPEQLDQTHTYIASLGTYSDLTCTSVFVGADTSGQHCDLSGIMAFSSGAHPFTARLIKDASGAWKIHTFQVR